MECSNELHLITGVNSPWRMKYVSLSWLALPARAKPADLLPPEDQKKALQCFITDGQVPKLGGFNGTIN